MKVKLKFYQNARKAMLIIESLSGITCRVI